MGKIKVRYNLGRGVNYMKWKISYPDGKAEYYNPTEVQLVIKKPKIKNNKRLANKIFEGGSKVVCAWIVCEDIQIITQNFNQSDLQGKRISYNPRIHPNWLMDGVNIDEFEFNLIESFDYGLYVTD
jgi:hypothetical protein